MERWILMAIIVLKIELKTEYVELQQTMQQKTPFNNAKNQGM